MSALREKWNLQNINDMPAVKFFARLILPQFADFWMGSD